MGDIKTTEFDLETTISDNDELLANISGGTARIPFKNIKSILSAWSNIISKPFDALDSVYLITKQDGQSAILTLSDNTIATLNNVGVFASDIQALKTVSHSHGNKETIDKFGTNSEGKLTWNSITVGSDYTLPVATEETLGGIKPDGTTITIDEDGTIHGANTYELPTASDTVLGGVKIDNDTIKSNNGVISADVIGNWSAGVNYPVGYFVVYGEGMWECMVAHTSESTFNESKWMPVAFRAIKIYNWSTNTDYYLYQLVVYNNMLYRAIEKHTSGGSFDESKWELISGGTTDTTINNWSAQTDYVIGDLVINGITLYQCNTNHTSAETFDETESANWTALSGMQGEKGNDGFSPTVTATVVSNGVDLTIVDKNGTQNVGIRNGTDGTDGNDGVSPVAYVTPTENGCVITVTDSSGTTTANLSNGVTPHIDETTKHWFIGGVDTGVIAEGVTTISTTSLEYTGILTVDGWVGDTAPYTQDITISGITSDLSPLIDLIVSDDVATSDEEIAQWSYITKATTGDNIITFRCNKTKPTIELNFKVKVV